LGWTSKVTPLAKKIVGGLDPFLQLFPLLSTLEQNTSRYRGCVRVSADHDQRRPSGLNKKHQVLFEPQEHLESTIVNLIRFYFAQVH